ncbi:ureidoglycolate lyase [Romeria aff. gracilis LEGE 07310]|uniref:Ureidoglycolate lyase n=1 Tax=Vasconcelosia minhoensis LEGE 07310 TaxID=915328 RepID=A0A8J7DAI1_9CYAN|nr:ureidoglycolate lyase [Romeria gracilis]MBE9076492.1 ureidoglycolate lyase [Romeria aff. gracilis LEGE 07310]
MSQTATLKPLPAIPITSENFQPFGQVIWPQPDSKSYDLNDAQLRLEAGTPRFYLMHLSPNGRRFHTITRHRRCTQCLGSLKGRHWWLAVAPPKDSDQPEPEDIQIFQIPGDCFVKLALGTWHAGPYFEGEPASFYNLELSDTNIIDHQTCDLIETYGLEFQIL